MFTFPGVPGGTWNHLGISRRPGGPVVEPPGRLRVYDGSMGVVMSPDISAYHGACDQRGK